MAANAPFAAQSQGYALAASGVVGSPVQVLPVPGGTVKSYAQYLIQNAAAADAFVVLAQDAVTAGTITVPVAGTPGNGVRVPAGSSVVLTGSPQAWFNAVLSSGTGTVYVVGGEGFLSASGGGSGGGSSSGAPVVPSAGAVACSVDRQVALTASPVLVKGSAGNLYGYNYFNPGSALAYVHLFDAATAGAVTLGTTVPKVSFPLPASATAQVGDENVGDVAMCGFASGIVIAATTTPNGSAAPGTALYAQTYFA